MKTGLFEYLCRRFPQLAIEQHAQLESRSVLNGLFLEFGGMLRIAKASSVQC